MRVEHERDIHPPGAGPDTGEVGNPELVGAQPCEVPVDEVSRPDLFTAVSAGLRRVPRMTPTSPSSRISRSTVQRAMS